MKHYSAFEAKTHFSEILKAVMNGETFIITKHGHEIAMIVPFVLEKEVSPRQNAIRALKKLRKGLYLKNLSIQEMRQEGLK